MPSILSRAVPHFLAITGSAGVRVLVPAVNAVVPRTGYRVLPDRAYGPLPRHRLDLYVPDRPLSSAPVLVFFYGGSWQSGSKNIYRAFGQVFSSEGMIVAIADYGLYPNVKYPTFLHDGAHVVRFLRETVEMLGGDPSRIVVSGHSAGAYIAAMLGVNPIYLNSVGGGPSWIRAVIGIAGSYDFLPLYDAAMIDIFGGARNMETQPIKYAANRAPPMLLAHGTKDSTVGAGNSRRFATRLLSYGNDVQVKLYDGIGHLDILLSLAKPWRKRTTLHADMLQFIRSR
ncbi:MAG: alpha/beta hydrolase [Alphaproteobacteria bacterium]|nr:alpha/beta hydrolase [Alphaproteobacteria bacterium]MBL6938629.1 alpha/beta hydrolase [Alphaproteobacteria bacterium]MBL7098014.1 alpha/beta hydrolase [Alphaproteobacteria bacterium]